MCRGVSASLYSRHSTEMARLKSKQGKGGKKVDAGKVRKSSHQNGEPMVANQAEIKAKKVRVRVKKECERDGCTAAVRSRGLCGKHGGGKRCSEPDCDKAAEKEGKCSGHGGSHHKPCYTEGCGNLAQKGGFCRTHQVGGHPTCSVEECGKWPASGKGGMCVQHFKEAQDATSGN